MRSELMVTHRAKPIKRTGGRAAAALRGREGGSPKGGGRRSRRPHRHACSPACPPAQSRRPGATKGRTKERGKEREHRIRRRRRRSSRSLGACRRRSRGGGRPLPPLCRPTTWELCSVALARRGRSVGDPSRSFTVSSARAMLNSWIGSLSAPKSVVASSAPLLMKKEAFQTQQLLARSVSLGPPNLLLSFVLSCSRRKRVRAQCFALLALASPARARARCPPDPADPPNPNVLVQSSSNALLLALITSPLLALLCISIPISIRYQNAERYDMISCISPNAMDYGNQFLILNPRPTERISAISWNIFNPAALSCSAVQTNDLVHINLTMRYT